MISYVAVALMHSCSVLHSWFPGVRFACAAGDERVEGIILITSTGALFFLAFWLINNNNMCRQISFNN